MNKLYTSLGIATLGLISLPSLASSGPTVYGKANVSFQFADETAIDGDVKSSSDATELKSNASRLGVKGSLKASDEIKAIYKFEFEVNVDDGDKGGDTITQRNIYLGLQGDFGTVKAGKFDSPLKVAQKKIDLFNDLEGDIKNLITVNDNRPSNIVGYESPNFNGFKGAIAVVSSEEDGEDDGISASLTFEQSGLYLALAVDQNVEAEDYDVIRLVGQYNFSDFQIGVLAERADDGVSDDIDAFFLSAKYKMGDWALKAQGGTSDINDADGETFSLGADYKLAKNLKVFGYYTNNESVDVEEDYLGAGVELKF